MTKIAKIKRLDNSKEFIKILKDRELLIYEDVQGSKIFIRWDGTKLIIKPKSLNNEPLNFIDLTVQKFYNQAYNFFKNIPDYITDIIDSNWWFLFEYFPDNQPANIEYKKIPKNNLILTCIVKKNKYYYNYDEIKEYSNLFDVDPLPVIFKGKLNEKQLEVIQLYLNTKEEDLKYIFDETNFAYFFYKILNPKIDNSFLMLDNEFNNNLEKIIIKIDKKPNFSFEILNPLYKKTALQNNSEYVEIYSLILVKFLEFSQLIDIEKFKLIKITKEELYVEFISEIFNKFIENSGKNLYEWDIVIPSFFKEDKFKINIELISNNITKQYLNDEKIEYIFKCILGSFSKKRKKPIGVFSDITLNLFNSFIEKLDNIINRQLKINREYKLKKDNLIDYKSYFNIDYNTDSIGNVYPDIYSEFDNDKENNNKKKKKDIKKIK